MHPCTYAPMCHAPTCTRVHRAPPHPGCPSTWQRPVRTRRPEWPWGSVLEISGIGVSRYRSRAFRHSKSTYRSALNHLNAYAHLSSLGRYIRKIGHGNVSIPCFTDCKLHVYFGSMYVHLFAYFSQCNFPITAEISLTLMPKTKGFGMPEMPEMPEMTP